MPLIEMEPGILPKGLTAFQQHQVYNCLDASITAQLVPVMREMLNANQEKTYNREMWTQALCLEMSTKGLPINKMEMLNLLAELDTQASKAKRILDFLCAAVFVVPINPNSWQQVEAHFYDRLGFPPVWKYDPKTKQRKRGTDRDSLEKLRETYPSAQPFVNAIFAYREAIKLASVFKKGLEPDGRLRSGFSPSSAETGRLASQTNPFNRGTNIQNWNERVRQVVEAPPGYDLAYVDLKTAESFVVGYASGCRAYIEACSSGDLHTRVSILVWNDLGWTGDLRRDKAIAEQDFYRGFSYRYMAKKGGHATNYYGKPPTIAKHMKVPPHLVEHFQDEYFGAFPEIAEWQLDVIARVQSEGVIITPTGRERMFWGRRSEAETHRKAIAHEPQSVVADMMNEGLCLVQLWNLKERAEISLLAQVHDAGLFLIPRDGFDERARKIKEILESVEVEYPAGTLRIPAEVQRGKNWRHRRLPGNPKGLLEYELPPLLMAAQ